MENDNQMDPQATMPENTEAPAEGGMAGAAETVSEAAGMADDMADKANEAMGGDSEMAQAAGDAAESVEGMADQAADMMGGGSEEAPAAE